VNLSGGHYYNGSVYFGTSGDFLGTRSGGIVKVDVEIHKVEVVVNSYFGLRVDVDDLAWLTQKSTRKTYLYSSSLQYTRGGGDMGMAVSR
jgi:hypothetical protein